MKKLSVFFVLGMALLFASCNSEVGINSVIQNTWHNDYSYFTIYSGSDTILKRDKREYYADSLLFDKDGHVYLMTLAGDDDLGTYVVADKTVTTSSEVGSIWKFFTSNPSVMQQLEGKYKRVSYEVMASAWAMEFTYTFKFTDVTYKGKNYDVLYVTEEAWLNRPLNLFGENK